MEVGGWRMEDGGRGMGVQVHKGCSGRMKERGTRKERRHKEAKSDSEAGSYKHPFPPSSLHHLTPHHFITSFRAPPFFEKTTVKMLSYLYPVCPSIIPPCWPSLAPIGSLSHIFTFHIFNLVQCIYLYFFEPNSLAKNNMRHKYVDYPQERFGLSSNKRHVHEP
ncbi:hypothetical protein BC939DRAFT_48813 [Gamsiella multidivaricata]|uniref:uncharacterized protein n=1 Tax=Gamsiella multidivaricata TaxID=101098 RepID=UPI002220DD53|nr:uncharacterized protein BC939DRAFT_48813 [Gamsiella multidivaricata]KAI7828726.1 hypothetical protein BC939DRAFT_48813 [Gamsiella multidivaricata]